MVKRLKLNEKTLREAEPKPGVSYQIFDTEVIGFAARVQASGARTFTPSRPGYVFDPQGGRYAVSVLINDPRAADGVAAIDALLDWLAAGGR